MKDDTKHLDDGGGFAQAVETVIKHSAGCDDDGPFEYELNLRVGLTADKLVKGLGDTAPDDVRTLIIELEKEVGLWALTILLGRYFAEQMEAAQKFCPELYNMSSEELIKELQESE